MATRSTGGAIHPTRQQLDELDALLQRMLDLPVNQVENEAPAAPRPPEASARDTRPPEPPARPGGGLRRPDLPSGPSPALRARLAEAALLRSTEPPALPAQPKKIEAPPPPAQPFSLEPRVIDQPHSNVEEEETPAPNEAAERQDRQEKTAEEWVPLRSSWAPSAHTWQPLAQSWEQAQAAVRRSAEAKRPEESELPNPASSAAALRSGPAAPQLPPETLGAPTQPPRAPAARTTRRAVPPPAAGPKAEGSEAKAKAPVPVWLLPVVWLNQVFDLGLGLWGPLGRWLQHGTGRNLLGLVGLGCLTVALLWAMLDICGWTW